MSSGRPQIRIDDLRDLAYGAALLGTGGGGDPYVGRLMAEQALRKVGGAIDLIPLDALTASDFVIAAGNMGAPTVLIEKLPSGQEPAAAVRCLERYLGRKATAILPFEAGGVNSTLPILIAAELGLPVVDGDGMGRAFPELQMKTFAAGGVSATPMTVSNEHGDYTVIETHSPRMAEWIAREVTIRMGGQTSIAEYPMDGETARRVSVPGTMSLCISLGRVWREARKAHREPFDDVVAYFPKTHYRHARLLHQGKISDLSRRTERGFAIGRIVIEDFGDGPPVEVTFQNENLLATRYGQPLAMVPDLICVLDHETCEPITTEWLRYGQRIKLLGISVPEIMRSREALALFGPRAFGLGIDYQPLEKMDHGPQVFPR